MAAFKIINRNNFKTEPSNLGEDVGKWTLSDATLLERK